MPSLLVVYSSETGCTAEVAERIVETIAAIGVQVVVRPAEEWPDPKGFDAVIAGSGVRKMRWYDAAIHWAEGNADVLASTPVGLFSVGLTPVRFPQLERRIAAYTFSLLVKTGVTPAISGNFKGCFDPDKLSMTEIAVVRALGVDEGDYREWDVIEAWAREAAEKLGLVVPTAAGRARP